MFNQRLCEPDCWKSMRCQYSCQLQSWDHWWTPSRDPGIQREVSIKSWPLLPPLFFFFFPSLFDSISNWEKQKVCDSLEKFKHSDAKQWKSLRQQPKPVSLKVRTQRLRVPSGKSEMADLNKTFPSIGKPQPGKGNEELQQMWHLYFWVPTCLFFELLFRALWDLYRSCKKAGASFSKCPAHVGSKCYNHDLDCEKKQAYIASFIHSFILIHTH